LGFIVKERIDSEKELFEKFKIMEDYIDSHSDTFKPEDYEKEQEKKKKHLLYLQKLSDKVVQIVNHYS